MTLSRSLLRALYRATLAATSCFSILLDIRRLQELPVTHATIVRVKLGFFGLSEKPTQPREQGSDRTSNLTAHVGTSIGHEPKAKSSSYHASLSIEAISVSSAVRAPAHSFLGLITVSKNAQMGFAAEENPELTAKHA